MNKTQIFPPPGQASAPPTSGFKIPTTAIIIGVLVVAAAITYFVITKNKNNGKEEKTYSGNDGE